MRLTANYLKSNFEGGLLHCFCCNNENVFKFLYWNGFLVYKIIKWQCCYGGQMQKHTKHGASVPTINKLCFSSIRLNTQSQGIPESYSTAELQVNKGLCAFPLLSFLRTPKQSETSSAPSFTLMQPKWPSSFHPRWQALAPQFASRFS